MKHILLSLALLTVVACGPEASEHPALDSLETQEAPVVTPPAGSIPPGMPSRLLVGLFEESGNWMRDSAVPWDVRYRYFIKGWMNNWGWNPTADGSWGKQFLTETVAQGFMPAVQYYQWHYEAGGGEPQFYAKTQNPAVVRSYFSDFKVLMQHAKAVNKPVLVMLEADGFGFLQQQSGHNPNAYAAVAASGMPELAGLPNTVAGWGLAFLQIRKAVGAHNVILGVHISVWAGGKDLSHFSVADPLQPEVDKVYNFLKPLGLGPNVTGSTFDVLVGDPLDRDADFYRLTRNENRSWDASDSAPLTSRSFNRYAEWLRRWNVRSGKRWVLWQIPLGNSHHLNVANTGNVARAGYKDNRAEYFFGPGGAAHREKFASSGVIALLFGRGENQQSSYTNDYYTDGQLFMKSRAGAFLKAGGLPIPAGSTTTVSPTPTPIPTPTPTGDTAPYHFESGTQGWASTGTLPASVTSSTGRAWSGTGSLAVAINGAAAGMARVSVGNAAVPAGRTVSFRFWLPSGSRVSAVQPYVQQGLAGGWAWTGQWTGTAALRAGEWNTVTVQVPANATTPMFQLGLEIITNAAWSGTVNVDSVSW